MAACGNSIDFDFSEGQGPSRFTDFGPDCRTKKVGAFPVAHYRCRAIRLDQDRRLFVNRNFARRVGPSILHDARQKTERAAQLPTVHHPAHHSIRAAEQARGAKDIDRRADVFAAGIVLWEVMAGRRLFKGEGEADTLNKVLHEPIPAVRSVAPKVPPAIEALLTRALDRDRTARFATAAEFADALEGAARTLDTLGTHKDVASHLDVALGAETAQQREALRSWLARAEPNRRSMPPPSMPPPPH